MKKRILTKSFQINEEALSTINKTKSNPLFWALIIKPIIAFFCTQLIFAGVTFGQTSYNLNNTPISGAGSTAFGVGALNNTNTGSNNVANGYYALNANTSGSYNTANGQYALLSNLTGSYNTTNGAQALVFNTQGNFNTADGFYALASNITGNNNTALGDYAGFSALGSGNVFLGHRAGFNETGSNKLYIANSSVNPPLIYGDFATGKIGIGTITPAKQLQIMGSSATSFTFDASLSTSGYTTAFTMDNIALSIGHNSLIRDIFFKTGNGTHMTIKPSGQVGIGISVPSNNFCKLQVDNGAIMVSGHNGAGGAMVVFSDNANTDPNGNWGIEYESNAKGLNFWKPFPSTNFGNYFMLLKDNGKIGMGVDPGACDGTSFNGNYKLFVNGGILTTKVKIANYCSANWADYVFAPGYKLKPLSEVETYVQTNKHLPGVPSAMDIEKEGLDVAAMQSKQMEKIEELTLYMIEMKKEIETLKKENSSLKSSFLNFKK